jgi:filamentous hemagglutinin
MANAINSSTVVNLAGTPSEDAKSIALATANGGIAVYQTDKELYVTEFNQQVLNQRAITEYSNVTQNISTITNKPAGYSAGLVQFTDANLDFAASYQFRFEQPNGSPQLTLEGNLNATTINGNLTGSTVTATGALSGNTLTVSGYTNVSNVIASGNVTAGNLVATADVTAANVNATTAIISGNVSAGNVSASLFTGTLATATQPNIASVANVLTVGAAKIIGNVANSVTIAGSTNNTAVSLQSSGNSASFNLTLDTAGNLKLPVVSSKSTVTSTGDTHLLTGVGSGSSSEYIFAGGNLTVPGNVIVGVAGTGNANTTISPTTVTASVVGATTLNVAANATVTANLTANNVNVTNNVSANAATITSNLFVGNGTSNVTFGSGNLNVTSNLIAGNANVASLVTASAWIAGDLTVTGSLEVDGTITYIDSTRTSITDPIIELGLGADGNANAGNVGGNPLTTNDGKDRGLMLHRFDTTANAALDSFMGWDNSAGEFVMVAKGVETSNSGNFFFGADAATADLDDINTDKLANLGNLRVKTLRGNVTGTHRGNLFGTDSTINSSVVFNDVTANAPNSSVVLSVNNAAVATFGTTNTHIAGTANISGDTTVGANLAVTANISANNVNTTTQVLVGNSAGNTTITKDTVTTATVVGTLAGNVSSTGNLFLTAANNTVSIGANAHGNIITVTSNGTTATTTIANNVVITGTITAAGITGAVAGNLVAGNSSVNVATSGNVTLTGGGGDTVTSTLAISNTAATFSNNLSVSNGLNVTNDITLGRDIIATANINIAATSTVDQTINVATGVTANGNTKTVNLGTGSTLGTTNINIGGTLGTTAVNSPLLSANAVTATGNVTGANFVGTLANGNSNVAIATDGNIVIKAYDGNSSNGTSALTVTQTGANITGTANVTGATVIGGNLDVGTINGNGTSLSLNAGNSNILITKNGDINLSSNGLANIISITSNGNANGATTTVIGNIVPAANITYDLGSSTNRFKDIWLSTSTIHLGNTRLGVASNGALTVTATTADGNVANTTSVSLGGTASGNSVVADANALSGTALAATVVTSNLTTVGTLTGLTIAANGNITMSNAGSQLTGANLVSANFVAGALTTNAQPNITSVGNLTSLAVTGNITAGNITLADANGVFSGNGSGLTNLTAINVVGIVANANSAVNLTNGNSNVIVTANGNITMTASDGNSTSVTTITQTGANITGTLNVTGDVTVGGNILPSGNVTKDIGSSTNRFKDIWLSNSTIRLGDTAIRSDGSGGIVIGTLQGNGQFDGATISSTGAIKAVANGTASTTVVAIDANTLGGTTLNSAVVTSSLTTVGTLGSLAVAGGDITVSSANISNSIVGGNITAENFIGNIQGSSVTGTVANATLAGTISIGNTVPANTDSTGTAGTFVFANANLFVCVATNSWVRFPAAATNGSAWV